MYLSHSPILSLPTKLKVPKPKLNISFVSHHGESIYLHDSRDRSKIRDRFSRLGLFFALAHEFTSRSFLTELAERIQLSLVVDVGNEILLERRRSLESVFELAALLYYLGDLAASEETTPFEVVKFVYHALETVLNYVRHCGLVLDRLRL